MSLSNNEFLMFKLANSTELPFITAKLSSGHESTAKLEKSQWPMGWVWVGARKSLGAFVHFEKTRINDCAYFATNLDVTKQEDSMK